MNSVLSNTGQPVAAMLPPSRSNTDPLDLIWGCAAIGRAIGKSAKATYYMCEAGELPCCIQVGRRWVASRRKLLEHFERVAG